MCSCPHVLVRCFVGLFAAVAGYWDQMSERYPLRQLQTGVFLRPAASTDLGSPIWYRCRSLCPWWAQICALNYSDNARDENETRDGATGGEEKFCKHTDVTQTCRMHIQSDDVTLSFQRCKNASDATAHASGGYVFFFFLGDVFARTGHGLVFEQTNSDCYE